MKFGSSQENPAPYVSTAAWAIAGTTCLLMTLLIFDPLSLNTFLYRWLNFDSYRLGWTIAMATAMTGYSLFTSCYQALNLFKQRAIVEVVLAVLLLPGLAIGYIWKNGNYETVLFSYIFAYGLTLAGVIHRFRHLLRWSQIDVVLLKKLFKYGVFACISNIGYILTFTVQPLQIEWAQRSKEVGIYRLYCNGSIIMAAFASGIFYAVFFPKVSAVKDRAAVWNWTTSAWIKGIVPVFIMFVVVEILTVLASGKQFPLIPIQVALFSLAATLITVQSTYGQILSSQGLRGITWGVLLSVLSGSVNFFATALLLKPWGLTGAVVAVILNYGITLVATFLIGQHLARTGGLADAADN
jgi:hypothetical protein